MKSYDAVVVGGRCAGAGTALLLARSGRSVLVLERAAIVGDTLSTHALLRPGVLQLARWGVLDAVITMGTPPVQRTTFHLADGDIPITMKPTAGVDAFYAPKRAVLDRILLDAAVAAGADVRLGSRVIDVIRRDGRVCGVRFADAQGRVGTVDAGVVIGADGRNSTVAAAVAAPVERVASASSSITYGYVAGLTVDGYRWWFRGGASAGAIPTNDHEVCVFAGSVSGTAGRPGRSPAETLRRRLADTAPELVDLIGPIRRVRGFTGAPGFLRRPAGPGWALVGDAGYFKDPITAHGMSDALRDAELLARAVIAADGDPIRQDEQLRAFHAERDRLSTCLFDVTEQLAGHQWSDHGVRDLLLRLSSSMVDEVEALLELGHLPTDRAVPA